LRLHRSRLFRHDGVRARYHPELLVVAVHRHPALSAADAAVHHDAAVCGRAKARHYRAALHISAARWRSARRQVPGLDDNLRHDAGTDDALSDLSLQRALIPAVSAGRRLLGSAPDRWRVYRVRYFHIVDVREPGDGGLGHRPAAAV